MCEIRTVHAPAKVRYTVADTWQCGAGYTEIQTLEECINAREDVMAQARAGGSELLERFDIIGTGLVDGRWMRGCVYVPKVLNHRHGTLFNFAIPKEPVGATGAASLRL